MRTNHAACALGNKMYVSYHLSTLIILIILIRYIHGGNYKGTTSNSYVLYADMHMLDTETMTWHEIDQQGEIPFYRVGHTLLSLDSRTTGGRTCNKIYLYG